MVLSGSQPYRGLLVQGRHGSTPVGRFEKGILTQPACSGVSVYKCNDWEHSLSIIRPQKSSVMQTELFVNQCIELQLGGT